jgi:hypothetical protein
MIKYELLTGDAAPYIYLVMDRMECPPPADSRAEDVIMWHGTVNLQYRAKIKKTKKVVGRMVHALTCVICRYKKKRKVYSEG